MINRRHFVLAGAASLMLGARFVSAAESKRNARLVVVVLRGGMDGLSAIVPYGDRHYSRMRGALAIADPAREGGALPLDGFFAAHPALEFFEREFKADRALAIHAVASPYRDRSHFDAQNVLELGLGRAYASEEGWLNRIIDRMPRRGDEALALGGSVPLILRGRHQVGSWSSAAMVGSDDDALARIGALYEKDPILGPAFAKAVEVDDMAGNIRGGGRFGGLVEAMLRFFSHPDGPRVMVAELGGWDTHANQGRDKGRFAARLRELDQGIANLSAGLGDAWADTVVLCVTEFGRTVRTNGTGGTDHGTASAVLGYGGALGGGRIIADWPGLAEGRLFQGRDLMPTTDLRAVYRAVAIQHLGLSAADADSALPETSSLSLPRLA